MSPVADVEDQILASDEDVDANEEQYHQLHEAISQLDNAKRIRPSKRKELGSLISEFHVQQSSGKLQAKDLASVLEKKKLRDTKLNKKAKKVTSNLKILPKPVEKPIAELIKRKIGFEIVKEQLGAWDAVVESHHVADIMHFPLNAPKFTVQDGKEFFSKFANQTELQKELNAVLHGGQQVEDDEEKDEFPLTLEEIIDRRKELAGIRARQSYREAKAFRQSKIKSKKYHRLQKKEKIRQQLKDFEILQKTDPEAALKKLEELEKTRALERATLKHRSTGKWAQNLVVRAKYDQESRKVLAEQLSISREATQKIKNDESSEDEGELDPTVLKDAMEIAGSNPWSLEVSSDVNSFISGFRKYWSEKNKEGEAKQNDTVNASKDTISDAGAADEATKDPAVASSKTPKGAGRKSSKRAFRVEDVKSAANEATKDPAVASSKTPEGSGRKSSKRAFKVEDVASVANEATKDPAVASSKTPKGRKSPKRAFRVENVASAINEATKDPAEASSRKTPKGAGRKAPKRALTDEAENSPVKTKKSADKWIVTPVKEDQPLKPTSNTTNFDIDDAFYLADEKLANKIADRFKTLKDKIKPAPRRLLKSEKKKKQTEAPDLKMKKSRWAVERAQVDEELVDNRVEEVKEAPSVIRLDASSEKKTNANVNIDPSKFLTVKKTTLNTPLGEEVTAADDDAVDDDEQRQLIMEAFADDNVVDFREEKAAAEAETKVDEVAKELPGWGSWGGGSIDPSKRRKKRRFMKIPELPARKDQAKPDVIISENPNPKIKDHMVKEVPFPFTSVDAFEANIRTPVSKDWVPELAQRQIVKPSVVTKPGTIIEPLSDDILIRNKPKPRSLYKAKSKPKYEVRKK